MKLRTTNLGSKWERLCENPFLKNLPYRIELSRHSQLIINPRSAHHSIFESRIIRSLIRLLPHGEALPECPIETDEGIFVADVAWASSEKIERNFDLPTWSESPDIVVEVLSPSNSEEEIRTKRNAVFAKGATEFWVCDRTGKLQFFNRRGSLSKSRLCPEFPASVAKASTGK